MEVHIEDLQVDGPEGRKMTVSVHARGGARGIREMTETGEMVFLPIQRIRTQRRGAPGHYRFYGVYQLPPECGGGELPVRLYENEADRTRGLNRSEHLRAIPPTDPDFLRLNTRRNDAESINRALGDTLHLRRAHSVGRLAQEADLLGFGSGMNALSWHRNRKRKQASAAA